MSVEVVLSEPVLADLLSINDYYLFNVSDKVALEIVDSLETGINGLADFPELGSFPKELLALSIKHYRQLIITPYRIIYEPLVDKVIVHAVLDGRRDMETLLMGRLLLG
jgi:toxin ParE1/3/4